MKISDVINVVVDKEQSKVLVSDIKGNSVLTITSESIEANGLSLATAYRNEILKYVADNYFYELEKHIYFEYGVLPTPNDTVVNPTIWRVSEDDIRTHISEHWAHFSPKQVDELVDMAHNTFSIPDHSEYIDAWIDQNAGDVLSHIETVIRQNIEEKYLSLDEKYIRQVVDIAEDQFTTEGINEVHLDTWVEHMVDYVKATEIFHNEVEKE